VPTHILAGLLALQVDAEGDLWFVWLLALAAFLLAGIAVMVLAWRVPGWRVSRRFRRWSRD